MTRTPRLAPSDQDDAELGRDEAARGERDQQEQAAIEEWNSQVVSAASRKAVTGSPEK